MEKEDKKTLKLYKYSPQDKEEKFEEVAPEEDDIEWESEHPLFMTKLPENIEENESLMALQGLKYDEQTVEELAESLKEKGNECFRKGGKYVKTAILWYSKALAEEFDDNEKRSVILSNRAAAHLELHNYGHTIEDCKLAIQFNPDNIKAYFRAAKASCELEKFDQAFRFVDDGLHRSNGNKQLIELRKDIENKEKISRKRKEEYEKKVKLYEEQRNIIMNTKGEWVKMLSKRGISIGRLLFPIMDDYLTSSNVKPYMDEKTKELHWPVLFYYDEYNQVDFIQDFCESDQFGSHLQLMFDGKNFCQWDTEKKYIHDQLEVYVIVNHVKPYLKDTEGKKHNTRSRKVRIKHTTTLKQVLEHPEYVVPGYPVFYIVVKESNFKTEFLKRPIIGGDDDLKEI